MQLFSTNELLWENACEGVKILSFKWREISGTLGYNLASIRKHAQTVNQTTFVGFTDSFVYD